MSIGNLGWSNPKGAMNFYLKKNFGLRLNVVQAMQMAHEQSELGLEQTTPNPCVGCAILDDKDELVGLSYHKKYGEAHAEVEAFATIPEDLKIKTSELSIFVTLEPCAHQGKTPSCAIMLAEKKVKRVIYLLKDPNPLVSGEGQKILDAAGVKTYCIEELLSKPRFDQPDDILKAIYKFKKSFQKIIKKQKYLNRQFLYAIQSDKPFVTLKWAQTLDGTIGLPNQRLLITNQEVQKEVHHLRACHDVILVGANTVVQDNPKLNNRFGSSKNKSNRICVIDKDLEILKNLDLEIFKLHDKKDLIFITHLSQDTQSLENEGYSFIKVDTDPGHKESLDLSTALMALKKKLKINSVFVEGGQQVLSSFLTQNLFNEIYIFNALKLIFTKNAVRLNLKFWIKPFFRNILGLRFRIFEADFLFHIIKS